MKALRFPLDDIRVRERVWPDGVKLWSIDGFRGDRLFQHFGTEADVGPALEVAYALAADHGVTIVQIVGVDEEKSEDGC